ncbi:hypothetical protein FQ137_01665 [Dietzia sp. ANT_WB102]|nr:hypothetical protein FQ137_01665 [Dietzia sp. ANT_WB102]
MGTDNSPVPEYAADHLPAPDDAPDASHLTPEEKHGPRTVYVALALLAALLIISVATDPASVLPRDSTLHGAYHLDKASGLELQVPVGWRVQSNAEFGTVEMRPVGTGRALDTRILAGPLESGIAAAAIDDDQGAATALAETVQMFVLGVTGVRDEQRTVPVANEAGTGASISYVVAPSGVDHDSGGLVYAAVFGSEGRRWWVAYVTTAQRSAPGIRWMDRIVDHVRLPW